MQMLSKRAAARHVKGIFLLGRTARKPQFCFLRALPFTSGALPEIKTATCAHIQLALHTRRDPPAAGLGGGGRPPGPGGSDGRLLTPPVASAKRTERGSGPRRTHLRIAACTNWSSLRLSRRGGWRLAWCPSGRLGSLSWGRPGRPRPRARGGPGGQQTLCESGAARRQAAFWFENHGYDSLGNVQREPFKKRAASPPNFCADCKAFDYYPSLPSTN